MDRTRTRQERTPQPFTGLAFCALLLVCGAVVSAAPRPVIRPLYCDYIKRLGTDFLNDGIHIPTAWTLHDGSVNYDRQAAFHVYALTASQSRPWANVTTERRFIRIRPLRLPGDSLPPGRAVYRELSGNPRFYYRPPGRRRSGRPVLLSFEYQCTAPEVKYFRYFLLDVLPSRSTPVRMNEVESSRTDGVERSLDKTGSCSEIQRLGIDYLADEREGDFARDTRSGTFQPGQEAAFQIYGLGQKAGAHQPLTSEFERIQVKLWTPPGSPSAAGTVRFENSDGNPRLVYAPGDLSSQNRAVVLTFGYRCGLHTHRRDFLLDIPPSPGVAPGGVNPSRCCGGS